MILGRVDPNHRHLEHFPAKWMPVRVEKMRQIKKLEPFPDSIEAGNVGKVSVQLLSLLSRNF